MLLDRLIRTDRTQTIDQGTILSIDQVNKRIRLRGQNGVELWAGYLPAEFPSLETGDSVAIGFASGSAFAIRQLASVAPKSTEIVEV